MPVRYEICVKTGERRFRLVARGEADSVRQAAEVLHDRVPHVLPLDAPACGCIYYDRGQPLKATRPANSKSRGLKWSGL